MKNIKKYPISICLILIITFISLIGVFYKDISYVLTDDNDYIKYFVITYNNKIGFYHKSKEVNKFLIDLLKYKDVKVIDSQYKNKAVNVLPKFIGLSKKMVEEEIFLLQICMHLK